MKPTIVSQVQLRDLGPDDLPRLYEFNCDPEANRLAGTIPRSAENFPKHWSKVLADPSVIAKAITAGAELAGCISCFQRDGVHCVGYWLGREFWGQGIASKALELLLNEVTIRPLHAQVATSNLASMRVLQKCGFVVHSVRVSPADERYLECEEATLVLE